MPALEGQLLLFTRQGCCLCDGLEEKLAALVPAPAITRIDVDGDPALQGRYGLEVPVLAVAKGPADWRELPGCRPGSAGKAWPFGCTRMVLLASRLRKAPAG